MAPRSLTQNMELVMIWLFYLHVSCSMSYDGSNQNLTAMPAIPANTTVLDLSNNNIAESNPDMLNEHPIAKIDLNRNQFTNFPDLEIVGGTLKIIILSNNHISTIPSELIDGLYVLNHLNLGQNQITTFPNLEPVGNTLRALSLTDNEISVISPEDLETLHVIRALAVRRNPLSALPNVSAIADTLYNIAIGLSNPESDTNTTDILQSWLIQMNFQALRTFETCCGGFTEFPNLGASCKSIEQISFHYNQVTAINQTYIKYCTSVTYFRMSHNKLQRFPDIRVMGATLQVLFLHQNEIHEVPDEYLQPLDELRNVHLQDNYLDTFPNFSTAQKLHTLHLSRNAIAAVDGSILSKMVSLKYLYLASNDVHYTADVTLPHLEKLILTLNDFQSFPRMTQLGKNLKSLDLGRNPGIKAVSANDLTGLEALESLNLRGTSLRSVPDIHRLESLQTLILSTREAPTPIRSASAYAMAGLRNLKELYLESTELELLPYPCAQAGLTLYLEHNDRLQLCDSRLAWLKDPTISVHVSDVSCGEQPWSSLSYSDVLLGNNNVKPGTTTGLLMDRSRGLSTCSCSGASILSSFSWDQCQAACLATWGCAGFNYNEAGEQCQLVSGVEHNVPVTEDIMERPGWMYFASLLSP